MFRLPAKPLPPVAMRWLRGWIARVLARPLRRGPGARELRAAIVKVDRLGDFVLALSAIRHALEYYGEERCLLVISPQVDAIAAREFPRTPRLVLPAAVGHKRLIAEGRRARKLLRDVQCDEVVCFRHQRWDWDELVLGWLDARRTYVLDDPGNQEFFAAQNTYVYPARERVGFLPPGRECAANESGGCLELEMHRQLLAAVTGRAVTLQQVLPRFEHIGRGSLDSRIVVSPLGSDPIRDFPESLLVNALHALRRQTSSPVALVGDPGQRPRLLHFLTILRNSGLSDVECAPPMTVVEFADAVGQAEMVLTVETATAHIAAASDRPAVILMGGGHYGQFGPWRRSARQIWVTHPLDCFGCKWRCIFPEPHCLTHITSEAVQGALAQVGREGASA